METETQEWKREWKSEYLKIIAAFFNTSGGLLVIGIDDDGEAIGVKDPKKLLKEIPDVTKNKLGIMPSVETVSEGGNTLIKITVEKGSHRVDLDGIFYKRVGSTTQRVTGGELRSWILSDERISWTDLTSEDCIDDVSADAIKHFVDAGKSAKRLPQDIGYDAKTILERFDLIDEDGRLKKAGALLFINKASNSYDGTYVKIGEFSKEGQLRREDRIMVPLIMQPDAVIEALYEKYIPGLFEYGDVQRTTVFRYPQEAVREALINAIVHKKYDSFEPITVRVDPNELSIYNSGPLPEGWTVEDLKVSHKSVRRNKKIADVFYRAGYVETWGKGIELIRDACRDNGNPDPVFNVRQAGLDVRFTPNRFIEYDLPLKLPVNLSENEISICKLINENNKITIKEIAENLKVNEKTVKRTLSLLTKKNLVIRVGPDKGGSWKLI
jgi:ATP-dependent DNA helicase RecG